MSCSSFFLWFGIVLGFLCLVGAMRTAFSRRLIDNLPVSKTSGVFIGFAKLVGSAESDWPLTSHLAHEPCVYYSWCVSEHWKRTVTETYKDEKGKICTRIREEEGWTCVASGGNSSPFFLKDDSGEILIQPEGATIEAANVFFQTCGRDDALYFLKGPQSAIADSDHLRRFEESAIVIHAPLCIFGQVREREDIVAPEIAVASSAPMYLISTRTPEQISTGYAMAAGTLGTLGLLLVLAACLTHDVLLPVDLAGRWAFYLFSAGGYLLAAALGWFWMAYNNLIDLRQRVLQGFSLIDIQLQRRHVLIPNLANAAIGMRDYERSLLARIATLRTRHDAVPLHAHREVMGDLIALLEAYPELKAHESFECIRLALTETEQRIELARSYFNEIATHYNIRLETIPDRFVAAVAGMRPQSLIGTEG